MDAKTYVTSESFCPAPWCNIYIDPNGDVRTCSIGKSVLGNINDADIFRVLESSQDLQTIKLQMLEGTKPDQCKTCFMIEESGTGYSSRLHYKKSCKNVELSVFDDVTAFETTTVDLRWSNACQNACVYCGPGLSSQWAKILGEKQKIETSSFVKSRQSIYDQLEKVTEVYLAGGEPLIAPENIKLLQVLHEVNPNVNLRVNTNISNLNTAVYSYCKKFKNLQFTLSAEALDKKFEYIRWPQTWNSFQRNLNIVTQEIPKINFNMVYNVLNSEEILNAVQHFLHLGYHENGFIITHAHRPRWADANNLSNKWLEHVYKQTENLQKHTDSKYHLYQALQGILNYIDVEKPKDIQSTIDNLCKLDKQRGLDSNRLFPEIYSDIIK